MHDFSVISVAVSFISPAPTSQIQSTEPPLDCWDYRYTVPATKKYSITNPQSKGTVFPLKKLVLSLFLSMCSSRSSFRVTRCTFFSADMGKTIDQVLMTRPLQTVIKLVLLPKAVNIFAFTVLLAEHHRKWSCLVGVSTCFRTQGTENDL